MVILNVLEITVKEILGLKSAVGFMIHIGAESSGDSKVGLSNLEINRFKLAKESLFLITADL